MRRTLALGAKIVVDRLENCSQGRPLTARESLISSRVASRENGTHLLRNQRHRSALGPEKVPDLIAKRGKCELWWDRSIDYLQKPFARKGLNHQRPLVCGHSLAKLVALQTYPCGG